MNTQIKLTLIIAVLLSSTGLASAQVYKTTDTKGHPQFSDKPDPDATEVQLQPINTVPPTEPSHRPAEVQADKQLPAYSALEITSPANEAIIPNGLAPTTVTVSINPALKPGHALQLVVNGNKVSMSSPGNFVIPRLNRGTNTLQLQVIEADKVIQQSATTTIFAYWPGK